MAGVKRDKTRENQEADVELTTPHGTEITVTAARAKALLDRAPVRFSDQASRKYVLSGDDNEVVDGAKTVAAAPRTGTHANTPEG